MRGTLSAAVVASLEAAQLLLPPTRLSIVLLGARARVCSSARSAPDALRVRLCCAVRRRRDATRRQTLHLEAVQLRAMSAAAAAAAMSGVDEHETDACSVRSRLLTQMNAPMTRAHDDNDDDEDDEDEAPVPPEGDDDGDSARSAMQAAARRSRAPLPHAGGTVRAQVQGFDTRSSPPHPASRPHRPLQQRIAAAAEIRRRKGLPGMPATIGAAASNISNLNEEIGRHSTPISKQRQQVY